MKGIAGWCWQLIVIIITPLWLVGQCWRERLVTKQALVRLCTRRLTLALPPRCDIWFHAASVGEVRCAITLARMLRAEQPALRLNITTMTTSGCRTADSECLFDDVGYLPIDLGICMQRLLAATTPQCCVLIETELWPMLLTTCRQRRVPVVVANARLSAGAFARYHRWRRLLPLDGARVLAQSTVSAERFRTLSAVADVSVAGNVKFDVEPNKRYLASAATVRRQLFDDRFVVTAGSTHASEHRVVIDAILRLPNAVAIVAPRYPQQAQTDFDQLAKAGYAVERYSALFDTTGGVMRSCRASIVYVDVFGVLQQLYALAHVAVIGGSFCHRGGQNPIEAAIYGVPMIAGPQMDNFADVVAAFAAADAIAQVADGNALSQLLRRWQNDDTLRRGRGRRAERVWQRQRGAAARMTAVIQSIRTVEQETIQ